MLGGHVWCEVRSLVSQQLSAPTHAWFAGKQKSPAAWQWFWQQLFEQRDITVIMHHSLSSLAVWKLHQCTSAWRHILPTRRIMFIRNQRSMSMSWSSIWLKRGQLHWSNNWSMTSRVGTKISMIQGGPKNGLFLRSDNFATTNDRKACNRSKVSKFCLE